MSSGNPTISILLSVYNGQSSISSCLASIKAQTRKDYEIICVNDASTDNTDQILKKWQKIFSSQKFTIIKNRDNLGLTKSLNIGLSYCQGNYIARIDADDTWHPEKLSKQTSFLKKHPETDIVGCYYINRKNHTDYHFKLPVTDKEIKSAIFRQNPFGHSCVLIKHALLKNLGGYDDSIKYGQDKDLWFRCYPHATFYNFPEYLCFRSADQGISVRHNRQQLWQGILTRIKYIHLYKAPTLNYLYILYPFLLLITPHYFKNLARPFFGQKNKPLEKAKKENIVYVNDSFFPSKYANAVARKNMARAFNSLGYINSIIFVYHQKEDKKNLFPSTKIYERPIRGPYLSQNKSFSKIWNSSVFIFNNIRLIFLKIPKEVTLIYMRTGALAGLALSLRNLLASKKLILEIHNYEFGCFPTDLIYKFIFSQCDEIITISNHTKDNWAKFGIPDHKIKVLPSGVDPNFFKNVIENKSLLRKKLSLPLDKKIVIYFGHLYRHRGIEDIIKAAQIISPVNNILFLVIGGHPRDISFYTNYIKNYYQNNSNINLLGYQSPSILKNYIKASDAILVTYSNKCPTSLSMSPLKLLEAMLSRIPIVCANLPALRQIADNSMVVFYQPDNPEDLADKIKFVLSAKTHRLQICEKSYQEALKYNWRLRAKAIIESASQSHEY